MWDDLPVQRKAPLVDMPASTRAFLSQFNRSFTPPALINDPYAVDRKLVITPLLLGPRPLNVSRNPFAVDPAIERVRHYVGCEELTDADLRPSPTLPPIQDQEWISDDEDKFTDERNETPIHFSGRMKKNPATSDLDNTGVKDIRPNNSVTSECFGYLDLTNATVTGVLPQSQPSAAEINRSTARDQPTSAPQSKRRNQLTNEETESPTDRGDKEQIIGLTPPPFHHDDGQNLGIGSPIRSNLKTMTSWDEWDEPPDFVCCFDPMKAAENRLAVQYDSLL